MNVNTAIQKIEEMIVFELEACERAKLKYQMAAHWAEAEGLKKALRIVKQIEVPS